MGLLVIGSIGLDRVDTPHGSTEEELGGSAVYFAFAASHFCPVRLVGVVGRDFPPDHRRRMQQRPIDLQGLQVTDGSTFRWHGAYRGRMNEAQTVQVDLNVLGSFQPQVPADYADSRFVFLANGPPRFQINALGQVAQPAFVMADTMNFYIQNHREGLLAVLERIDAMILNDAEAIQLSGRHNLLSAARWVTDRGPSYCVIKKGEHGALFRGSQGAFVLPGFPHESVIDPTGAGDAFAGGMMGYLAGRDEVDLEAMKRALAYGTITASFAIEQFGLAGLEGVDQEAIERRLGQFVRCTHLSAG